MDETKYRKFRQARDQMYNYSVYLHAFVRESYPRHPTKELQHLVDVVEEIVEQHLAAFMEGNIVAVSVDVYVPTGLPGFEGYVDGLKSAVHRSGANSERLGDTSTLDDIPF